MLESVDKKRKVDMNSDDSLDNLILDEVPETEKTKTGNTGND